MRDYDIRLGQYGDSKEIVHKITHEFIDILGYESTIIKTDKDGFIIDNNFTLPKNVKRIFVLGDSFIECSYIPDGQRLTDIVNAYFINKKSEFRVYNGGRSGSSILVSYNLFINKIIPYGKSIVIIFPGSISASCNRVKNNFWNRMEHYSPFTNMDAKRLYNWNDNYSNFIKILYLFLEGSKIFDIKLILGVVPYNHAFTNEPLTTMQVRIREFCLQNSLYLIDLDQLLQENSHLFYDKLHLNAEGAKFYGERMSEMLSSSLDI